MYFAVYSISIYNYSLVNFQFSMKLMTHKIFPMMDYIKSNLLLITCICKTLKITAFCWSALVNDSSLFPSLDSPVYCHGDLLDTIQRRALYDSKDFVDMALRYDPDDVMRNFLQLPDNPTDQQLRQFVDDNFSPMSDLISWSPPDWVQR